MNRYSKTLVPFVVLLAVLAITACNFMKGNAVENLQTEFMVNPIGVDKTAPRFSWVMESSERGVSQLSYQIVVSEDKNGNSLIWDSGSVNSSESANIKYGGEDLKPSTRYYWSVTVTDNKGNKLTSKEPAYFETGLMDSSWSNAQWISYMSDKESKGDSEPVCFDLEMDITMQSDNMGIIFGAENLNNMYMWSINTSDYSYPALRRHTYVNGNPNPQDVSMESLFSTGDLIGKESHLKISVQDKVIETYLGGKLVDKYETPTAIKGEYIGFRAFKGNDFSEHAYIDNIILTSYVKNEDGALKPVVTFKEDFENGSNDFEGVETITENNNTKLNVFSKGNDFRVLQSAASDISMFRTKFALNKKVESARIYSSALGMYDLFINGERVGRPMEDGTTVYDEIKPGWTDYNKTVFYSTYDVTNLLNKGENAIGAVVSSGWLTGGIAFGKYGNPQLGFITKLLVRYADGTSDTFVTNTQTWKASKQSAIRSADIYHGEHYDARMESDWTSPNYNDANWNGVKVNPYFKGEIKAFVGPPVQIRPELNREPQTITIYDKTNSTNTTFGEINVIKTINGDSRVKLKRGETAIFDFGQNLVGWIHFKIKAESGTKLRARFSEMLNDSGERSRGNDNAKGTLYLENLRSAKATLRYTFKGDKSGEEFRPSMTFFGFRYCEISASEDIVIDKIVAEVIGSVTKEGSSMSTSNEAVNQLYSNVMWGQRGNFVSIPTDCPQRDERLGWTGDTQVFCRAAAYNANVSTFFHKWMGDMRDSQREDGAYPDVAPHAWVSWGQTAWGDAGIIVPWTIYLMYNDISLLEDNYESMEKYMTFLANQKTDEYLYNGAGTAFGDWLSYEATDKRFISVCYYAYTADLMSKMANALNKKEESQKYKTLYDNVKKEFQTRYVESDGALKEKSQTAYLLALKLNLFPSELSKTNGLNYLLKKIADNGYKLSTGFVGTGILNQTLSDVGGTKMAYNLLLQRGDPSWLYSVDQGATTIWERWNSYTIEKGFGDPGMNSFNHYSYGAVAEWMYRYMAGIDADQNNPGFKHIILHPNPDTRKELPQGQERITKVDATYASIYGDIKSKWVLSDNGDITYQVTIPANTTATFIIPKIKSGSTVSEKNTPAKDVEGVISVEDKTGEFVLELGSGSYIFDVR